MKKVNAIMIVLLLAVAATAQTNWTIDKEHSHIGFGVSHFGVSETKGFFRDFDATVIARSEDLSGAAVTFTAKTASIFTGNERRDRHLQSEAFLSAQKYPELKFTGVLAKENEKYFLKGDLTIRDVTKLVTFPLTYVGRAKDSSFKMDKIGFTLTGSLSRAEYGLKWNETFQGGGPIVGDKVELHLIIELNREG